MSEEMIAQQPQELSVLDSAATVPSDNLLLNTKALNLLSRVASKFSNSEMVPDSYRGKPDNCFVACELAARMNVSPTLVMQNLYIVHGKPSWSGQACIALINGSGLFDADLEFVTAGTPGNADYCCYAKTLRNGKEIRGTTITMQMVKDEGWSAKSGSKWRTMPEQMMKYRAAAFFARVYCPNVLMGFQTTDELNDTEREEKPKTVVTL